MRLTEVPAFRRLKSSLAFLALLVKFQSLKRKLKHASHRGTGFQKTKVFFCIAKSI
jgi:hypothetical protein